MTSRLFISLDLQKDFVDYLIELRNSIYPEDNRIKWEKRNKLHITLKFLGDTEENEIEKIENKLNYLFADKNCINLEFTGFGVFSKNGKPVILWAGFKENSLLNQLATDIDRGMNEFGFELEKRKFKSHITLLRIKGSEDFNRINKMVDYKPEKIETSASEITLYKSILKPAGSEYYALKKYSLE